MKEIWKRFKQMGPRKGGGERGFTLIEMLIVMVIIAILLGGVIYAVGGFGGGAESTSYSLHRQTIQNACLDYWVVNDYAYPVYDAAGVMHGDTGFAWGNATGQPGDQCAYVDLCLLADLGYFEAETVPSSAVEVADSGTSDNCDGATVCDCHSGAHYVWYWNNTDETVISTCPIAGCTANADGYQDVFP